MLGPLPAASTLPANMLGSVKMHANRPLHRVIWKRDVREEPGPGDSCNIFDAVALRAALESAVQLGRADEMNRQAEMANPTKCRDLLQGIFCIFAR
jgi:hypothetical protein